MMNLNQRGSARPPGLCRAEVAAATQAGAPENLQNADGPAGRPGLPLIAPLLALTLCAATCLAANVTSTIDGGGQRATSANYATDNSIGGIGGISSAAADTSKNGYIGQLTEVVSMSATRTPSSVNEGATSQLSGSAAFIAATNSSIGLVPSAFRRINGRKTYM